MWDAGSGSLLQKLPADLPVLDISPFTVNGEHFLASLTEKMLKLYKWEWTGGGKKPGRLKQTKKVMTPPARQRTRARWILSVWDTCCSNVEKQKCWADQWEWSADGRTLTGSQVCRERGCANGAPWGGVYTSGALAANVAWFPIILSVYCWRFFCPVFLWCFIKESLRSVFVCVCVCCRGLWF